MSYTQPTYKEFLDAANVLVEKNILITVKNIKAQLGGGTETLLKTYMLKRERHRMHKRGTSKK